MPPEDQRRGSFASADQQLVLSSLELDQLAAVKKRTIPRRHLRGFEKFVLWSLRIYVLFMIGVIIYQAFAGAR